MPISDDDLLLIQDFLNDALTVEEKTVFDQKMSDPLFAKEIDIQRNIRNTIFTEGRFETKARIKAFENNLPKRRLRYLRPLIGIAASLAILISVFTYIWTKPISSEKLFTEYYKPMANAVDPLTKGSDNDLSGFQLYESSKYQEAINLFSEVPNNTNASFYKALSHIALGEFSESNHLLEEYIRDPNNEFLKNAEWYLLLSYLGEGYPEKTSSIGKQILKDPQHPYYSETLEINNRIKK